MSSQTPMRTVQVVTDIETKASGVSYSLARLCGELALHGDLCLVTTGQNGACPELPFLEKYPVLPFLKRLRLSPRMHKRLVQAAGECDILHVNGLWTMPCVYPGWAVRRTACKLVVSPRGMLSVHALRYSALTKKAFWTIAQGPVVRRASCIHATSVREYEDVRSFGLRRQPVCIIPNGIDVPEQAPTPSEGTRKLLFLGRIHPIKGVDTLLRAWAAVSHKFKEWELLIAGPEVGLKGYLDKMRALAQELKLERARFCGALYGQDKLAAYRDAELFVLPSLSENFGNAVAESLAAGTPAIVSKGAPWGGLEEHHAGWWIEVGLDPLVGCLEDALSRSREELIGKGQSGRDWMIRDYSWAKIGQMMHLTYEWLLSGGEKPEWVRID
ncbi:MAG: glycosyltransferase [Syntrophobacteraceae bacterium]